MAVLLHEPGSDHIAQIIADELRAGRPIGIGAPTLVEASIVVTARLGHAGQVLLDSVVDNGQLVAINFRMEHYRAAAVAFAKYGKGRHPAGLNFGDCLTYAIAQVAQQPLLCVGFDFAQTDIPLVPLI